VQPLCDCDFGRWRGLRLNEVLAAESSNAEQWLADLSAAPHGGESLAAVHHRASTWLAGLPARRGSTVAITNAVVIRHLVVEVLAAPPESFWRIDVPPLSCVELASNGKRWVLRTS
jgi:broad specificity phosphatase PhoE